MGSKLYLTGAQRRVKRLNEQFGYPDLTVKAWSAGTVDMSTPTNRYKLNVERAKKRETRAFNSSK